MIDVNLTSPILLTFYLLDQLTDVININSMVGLEIKPSRTLYSATKWGLRGFAQSLKEENKNTNILDVYPTNIKTTPDKQNAMDVDFVVDNIYDSFLNKKQTLILDGRK
jgi:short-subunit dehydrogenase